ncbi:MAG: DUF2911 domain-containing protein [Salibacteraceae bacterium]
MKASLATISLTLLSITLSMCQSGERKSPSERAIVEREDISVSIDYSRPYKNDRLIFGTKEDDALVPYGKVWRTGANEATELTITKNVTIAGNSLEAGTYSLYTIPGEKEWTIAINSRTDYWGRGLIGSPFKDKQDVFRFTAPVQPLEEVQEQFLIKLEHGADGPIDAILRWDKTHVQFEIIPE